MTYGTIFPSRLMIASLSLVRTNISTPGVLSLSPFPSHAAIWSEAELQGKCPLLLAITERADSGINGFVQ